LAGVTTGWTDASIEGYVAELAKLSHPEALRSACHKISLTWSEARRPPLSQIINLYHGEMLRMERPALPSRDRTIPPRQGVEVARDAYVKECKRVGQRVNMDLFDRIMEPIVNRMAGT